MAFEYLFAALPPLPADPGSPVSLAPARLHRLCAEEGGKAARLSGAILLAFDLRALELAEFGVAPSETAVVSRSALRERGSMPAWLSRALDADASSYAYPFDRVWTAYFRELQRLARETGSAFLARWVSWDAGLRIAVARLRAKAQQEPERAFAAEGLSEEHASEYRPVLDALISHVEAGFDGWREMDRLLCRARLAKLRELAPAFTFDLDELLGYAAQYVILRSSRYLSG